MAGVRIEPARRKLLIADDHPLVREGLRALIHTQGDLEVCGEASTPEETRAAVEEQEPDLVVLDLRLKGGDGLHLIKSLKGEFPELRILVLSAYDAGMYVERALRAGALGFLAKDQAAAQVLTAIRTVLAGQLFLTGGAASVLLHRFVGLGPRVSTPGTEKLTDRELHVLQLLGAGLRTREIAEELHLSCKTIETHRENIKRKLGLEGAAQLLHFASEWAGEQVSVPAAAIS